MTTTPQDALKIAREALQKVRDWNAKYPSSRVYSHGEIVQIARKMDEINAECAKALADTAAHIVDANKKVGTAEQGAEPVGYFVNVNSQNGQAPQWEQIADEYKHADPDYIPLYAAPTIAPVPVWTEKEAAEIVASRPQPEAPDIEEPS